MTQGLGFSAEPPSWVCTLQCTYCTLHGYELYGYTHCNAVCFHNACFRGATGCPFPTLMCVVTHEAMIELRAFLVTCNELTKSCNAPRWTQRHKAHLLGQEGGPAEAGNPAKAETRDVSALNYQCMSL